MKFQAGIVNPSSMVVNIDNKVYQVAVDHPNWDRLKDAYKAGDADAFLRDFDVKEAVKQYVEDGEVKDSKVTIEGDQVLYNGNPVHNSVTNAIQRMISEGFDIKPMVKFLENMMQCPSYNSIKEMWRFIEVTGLTITEDGCFLAYKAVRSDYTDKHTGRIDNKPGANPPRLERNQVDDNCNNACSHGYHVGALAYAGPDGWFHSPGDHIVICKVNPMDVVSVPYDCSSQKLRCCYYEPVGEFEGELKSAVYSGEVGDRYTSKNQSQRGFKSECVDAYGLLEDSFYIGTYRKADGTASTRYFLVTEVYYNNRGYTVMLVEPEEYSGQYRTFHMDSLSQVMTWDGETDPALLNDPYYEPDEDYYEPDEDNEFCDYCGESMDYCDGYECREEDEDDEDDDIVGLAPRSYW